MALNTAAQTARQTVAHAQPQSKSATEQVLDESLPPILQDLLAHTAATRSKLKPGDKYRLLKSQIAPGCTDDELALFLEVAQMRGLDPFAKQIYAIRRKSRAQDDRGQWVDVWKMTIQTGIDGFRLIASRKDPGYTTDDTVFEYDAKAIDKATNPLGIVKATVRIWKTGATRAVEASAYWDEYRQAVEDRNGNGKKLTGKWADMPRNQIGKCAEALALRKAFPEDLSGLYTDDEMDQADNDRSVETLMPHVVAAANSSTPSMRASKPASTDYTGLVADLKKITKSADAMAWVGKPEIKARMQKLSDAEYDKLGDEWRAHANALEAEEKKAQSTPTNTPKSEALKSDPSTAEESAMAGGGQ